MARKLTREPIIGGASVVGLAFDDGVIIAADNLSSYGSSARFRNFQRIIKVNKDVIIGASGDMADFQHVCKTIEQKELENSAEDDKYCTGPLELHTWLTRLQYSKRSKFEPYWVEWVVGGLQDGKPFLGYVDKLGLCYQDKAIASGRLGDLAVPLLREYTENHTIKLNEQQAKDLVIKALTVLFYKHCYTTSTYHIATITKDKEAHIEGPFELVQNWQGASFQTKDFF